MSDKPIAMLVTAVGIAPICALCILGPAVLGSLLAGAFAWLGATGPVLTIGLMIVVGLLVYRTIRRRKVQTQVRGQRSELIPAPRPSRNPDRV
jgi:uncharacterized membrane protein YgaE (UPF0421/DUF939 family)